MLLPIHRSPKDFTACIAYQWRSRSRSGRKVESCSVHRVVRAIVHIRRTRRRDHFASNWDMVIVKFLSFERNSDGCGWNCIACFNDRLCGPDFRVGIVRGCSVWNQIESNERKLDRCAARHKNDFVVIWNLAKLSARIDRIAKHSIECWHAMAVLENSNPRRVDIDQVIAELRQNLWRHCCRSCGKVPNTLCFELSFHKLITLKSGSDEWLER